MNDEKFAELVEETQELVGAIAGILTKGVTYSTVSVQCALSWWLAHTSVLAGTSKEDVVKEVVGYYDDLKGMDMSSGEIQ
jgi:hypothetical protein